MKMGPLSITFHRTVRVAEGRTPANLPPSLGHIRLFEVKNYRERCPETWEDEGIFLGLHDTEALWMSFHTPTPVALMVGAGSINALNGKPLGTKLEKGGYLVTPPQPWLDGWKATDGTVYQFVATAYEKGKGNTVAEQLIGEKSKTGGIGLALFESKEPLKTLHHKPYEGYGSDPYGDVHYKSLGVQGMSVASCYTASMGEDDTPVASASIGPLRSAKPTSANMKVGATSGQHTNSVRQAFKEMGLGKGGKIVQKVYEDPYGLEVWKELPSQTRAIYIVHAELLAEITGQPIPPPVTQESYQNGPWFALKDEDKGDVAGTDAFTGLKSVFAEEQEPAETEVK